MPDIEPAWESVRVVPKVRADFGDGHAITKTFRGNIATYVCESDGSVVDVLPGLYSQAAYLKELGLLSRHGRDGREPAMVGSGGRKPAPRIAGATPAPQDAMESMLSGANVPPPTDLSSDTDGMSDLLFARAQPKDQAFLP